MLIIVSLSTEEEQDPSCAAMSVAMKLYLLLDTILLAVFMTRTARVGVQATTIYLSPHEEQGRITLAIIEQPSSFW